MTKRKRRPTPYSWLREQISSFDIGKLCTKNDGSKYSPHLNTKKDILAAFNRDQWWRIDRLCNADFDDHFSSDETFYFAAGKGPRSLIMVDVDCKRMGSPEGATGYCEFLSETFMPGLYHEPSTNGRGRHGYFQFETWDFGAEPLNRLLLHRLQPHLNRLAAGFDIEFVEIKGTFPVLNWGQERGRLNGVRCGCLAKLPREVSRFEEWQKTTVLTPCDLRRLPVNREPELVNKRSVPVGTVSLGGSSSCLPVSSEDVERLPQFVEVAVGFLSGKALQTTGRHVATAEDLGIMLLLGKCFTEDMNADGTMPRARFEKAWTGLYQQGSVSRAFCKKRFAAMRNFLSSKELIDWEDENYRVATIFDENGRGINGVACKWRYSEELMAALAFGEGREGILGGTLAAPAEDTLIPATISLVEGGESILGGTLAAQDQNIHLIPNTVFNNSLDEDHCTVPIRVFDSFDYLSAADKVDGIVQTWTPQSLLAA